MSDKLECYFKRVIDNQKKILREISSQNSAIAVMRDELTGIHSQLQRLHTVPQLDIDPYIDAALEDSFEDSSSITEGDLTIPPKTKTKRIPAVKQYTCNHGICMLCTSDITANRQGFALECDHKCHNDCAESHFPNTKTSFCPECESIK